MDARTKEADGLPATRLAWLSERFRQHPKTGVLSLAVVWGGAIVLHHFYSIVYLPVLAMSDLLGVAMADVYSTARSGRCVSRQELADSAIPLEIRLYRRAAPDTATAEAFWKAAKAARIPAESGG